MKLVVAYPTNRFSWLILLAYAWIVYRIPLCDCESCQDMHTCFAWQRTNSSLRNDVLANMFEQNVPMLFPIVRMLNYWKLVWRELKISIELFSVYKWFLAAREKNFFLCEVPRYIKSLRVAFALQSDQILLPIFCEWRKRNRILLWSWCRITSDMRLYHHCAIWYA